MSASGLKPDFLPMSRKVAEVPDSDIISLVAGAKVYSWVAGRHFQAIALHLVAPEEELRCFGLPYFSVLCGFLS